MPSDRPPQRDVRGCFSRFCSGRSRTCLPSSLSEASFCLHCAEQRCFALSCSWTVALSSDASSGRFPRRGCGQTPLLWVERSDRPPNCRLPQQEAIQLPALSRQRACQPLPGPSRLCVCVCECVCVYMCMYVCVCLCVLMTPECLLWPAPWKCRTSQ